MEMKTSSKVRIAWFIYSFMVCAGHQTVCKEGWEAFGDSCYFFSANLESWHSALDLCTTEGGHLVRITSRAENEYLKMRVRSFPDSYYWIDVTDQASPGTYVYGSTQAPVNFVDWNPGQPNNNEHHCVGLSFSFGYKWGDFLCTNKRQFICEMKAEEEQCKCRYSCCES